MIVSTKGKYAVRVMADMASHGNNEYLPLKEIAERQNISQKYLESIMSMLVKNSLVEGASGKGGGYRLIKKPEEYSLGEILRTTEGDLEPVACASNKGEHCERESVCHSLPIWRGLSEVINNYLNEKTLRDAMEI